MGAPDREREQADRAAAEAAAIGGRPSSEPPAVDEEEPGETVARVTLRPIGSPLPLGAFTLVPSGILIAGQQLNWFSPAEARAGSRGDRRRAADPAQRAGARSRGSRAALSG